VSARLVVLISGSGTNLQALLDACAAGELDAGVVAVVSNRKNAYGLVRATRAHVPTIYFPLKAYRDAGRPRLAYDDDLGRLIGEFEPDLVVMAGWMHIVTPAFLDHFGPRQVLNLHPALPGQFPGLHAIRRSFEAFRAGQIDQTGCMVHYVIPEVDAGEAIVTETVPIRPDDTLETYAERVHQAEHRIIVEAVRQAGGSASKPT
jgi:formyltetrahydrofolate-dependent phosphoribosylglycinamide formyltransferase